MEDSKDMKIKASPKEKPEIGIDQNNTLVSNITNAAINDTLDISKLEGFLNVTNSREDVYRLIDQMGNDSTVSSILETYAEDVTETNDKGKIVWAESSDAEVGKYVNFLLDSLNIDKYIYKWTYGLCKYGDVYLKLFRHSDYDADVLPVSSGRDAGSGSGSLNESKDRQMNESVYLVTHGKQDHYVPYLEMVSNPGEMFELTRFGKTAGYVRAPASVKSNMVTGMNTGTFQTYMQYQVNQSDVSIYGAGEFVHASLDDNSSRTPEEVQIFLDKDGKASADGIKGGKVPEVTYTVRRGQSLLYNSFKIWRQLTLMENSILLSRLTKSSIVRVVQVEVGDMPREQIGAHLQSIKQLLEQKSALNTGDSMTEYTNPGPIENNIYVPTHDGVGALTTSQIGGDVDPKQLTDLDYFQNKFFGSLRVPKQFFGLTDDGAGFNGGSSLSIISSRYGKSVKRIQSIDCQLVTDIVNLMLLDRGLNSYINKFSIRMCAPVTQEEIDKRDNMNNRLRVVNDTMSALGDISDPVIKLKILKAEMSTVVQDPTVIGLIQEQIDELEKGNSPEKGGPSPDTGKPAGEKPERSDAAAEFSQDMFGNGDDGGESGSESPEKVKPDESGNPEEATPDSGVESGENGPEPSAAGKADSYLPSASELGVDLTKAR